MLGIPASCIIALSRFRSGIEGGMYGTTYSVPADALVGAQLEHKSDPFRRQTWTSTTTLVVVRWYDQGELELARRARSAYGTSQSAPCHIEYRHIGAKRHQARINALLRYLRCYARHIILTLWPTRFSQLIGIAVLERQGKRTTG